MRVLVVHNRYSSLVPSGENVSVDSEVQWLREAGVEVTAHQVSNDDAMADRGQRLRAAIQTPWSPFAAKKFRSVLQDVRPDVVHVHNLFPLLSASVPAAALRTGTPVVWTARNHRVVCVDGTHFRDGKPCHSCRPGWRAPGIWHGCYRGSAAASALVTGSTAAFRWLARRRIPTIAISQHLRSWLIDSAGFAPDQVTVKYNGVAQPAWPAVPGPTTSKTFLFAAKLAEYKGLALLLEAWRRAGDVDAELQVVGDGPLAEQVRTAAAADPRITWVGQVPPTAIPKHIAAARAVVVPSIWAEPFGRAAAEALALGRPVLTTGFGGLSEVVDDATGWTTGNDPAVLANALTEAATSDAAVATRSRAAAKRYEQLFSPKTTTHTLLGIYESTLRERR